jgi:preprotein translocase subunit YajC
LITSIGVMLVATAQAAQGQGGRAGLIMMIYFVAFIAIMWFIVIAPQRKMQKKHEAMVAGVQKGDEVVTEGGIIGSVIHLTDDRLTIKTGDNTRVVIARGKIARVMGNEPGTN